MTHDTFADAVVSGSPSNCYGIVVWGSDSNLKKLFVLQKKAIRLLAGVSKSVHCKPLFKKFSLLTVTSFYVMECLIYVKKNEQSFLINGFKHNYNTRQRSDLTHWPIL